MLPSDYIVWVVLALLFNVLDSVTTEIALHKIPVELRAKEANPIMGAIMKRKPVIAEIIKQGGIIALVVWAIKGHLKVDIVFLAVAFGLVVMSNSYVLLGRVITRKKVQSPLLKLQKLLRIPARFGYLFAVVIIMGIAWAVANYWVM